MYAIKVNNEIAGYSDSFVYIRRHTGGREIQLVALGDKPTIDIPVTLIIRRDL